MISLLLKQCKLYCVLHHNSLNAKDLRPNSKNDSDDFGKEDIVYEILDICEPEFHEEKLKEIVVFLNAEVIWWYTRITY